jgi:hypothetical protein
MRIEFRLLVDAIQSGDLGAGRDAYRRLLEVLADIPPALPAEDMLARIGLSLSDGDLTAARDTLDVLHVRALEVLRRAEPEHGSKRRPVFRRRLIT